MKYVRQAIAKLLWSSWRFNCPIALCDVFLPDGNGVDLVLDIKKVNRMRWKIRRAFSWRLILSSFRISFQVHLPPLRERTGDIKILATAFAEKFSEKLSAMERRHIARVLEYTKGNKTEAARLLKIGLTTLYRKIEEYKIWVEVFDSYKIELFYSSMEL